MGANPTLGSALNLCFLIFLSRFPIFCFSYNEPSAYNSFSVSSFRYSDIRLKPYDWRYIRVDLPPWFSSLYINLESDVDIDKNSIRKLPKGTLPWICFRNGSPPLPDVSRASLRDLVFDPLTNGSVEAIQDLQHGEQCHLLPKNIMLTLTNEQISPGVWYVGLFNGIGSARTQSKMINRGSTVYFSANVSVDGCTTSTMWGPFCNQTVVPLSCAQSDVYNHTGGNVITCRNSYEAACHNYSEPKIYSLDVVGMTQQLKVFATYARFNQTPSNNTQNFNGIVYARHGAIPLSTFHDYSSEISKTPLIISSPKVGRWYIAVVPINQSDVHGVIHDKNVKADFCYSLDWEVYECRMGKAGLNCTSESYMLQTVIRKNPSIAFESYYLPIGGNMTLESAMFPLEPLLSNSSVGDKLDVAWTYFHLNIPHGAAGGNIHIYLKSDAKLNYEIYSRYGGLPSLDTWDYYYANATRNSNNSMFFKLYDSSDEGVSFYILYAKEGTWSFGLKHPLPSITPLKGQTTMSISIERCPKGCSTHGSCQQAFDSSGLTIFSFCSCDRTHGGFDCSIEIVSHKGHIYQSIALIASNAAAFLPAIWALRQKAFAEWVLFTSSGIFSALYHACDVGTWCALTFRVLQFMDFWLSFMAVVSTFVYLATIDEVSKRAIHTSVSVLTALMAINGATRSTNIILVIAIGASGLLIAWLIEFSTTIRSISCSTQFSINITERLQNIKGWIYNIIKTLRNRFRWFFVIVGFVALSMAAISWNLESTESYWIWHSVWHISIYTSSFFFLCSKINTISRDNEEGPTTAYELTRQDSFSRGQ